jgi:quinol monooxygenase YgiN
MQRPQGRVLGHRQTGRLQRVITSAPQALLNPFDENVRNLTKEKIVSTITAHADHATLINVFTVQPERARELADLLTAATEDVMQHIDGFISANIHLSTDGTRVVNYAQWRSAEAMQAMRQDPTAREHMAQCAELADGFEPHLYTVESVHSAP